MRPKGGAAVCWVSAVLLRVVNSMERRGGERWSAVHCESSA